MMMYLAIMMLILVLIATMHTTHKGQKTANYWIKNLFLQKHPEGGFFKEIYKSDEIIKKQALPKRFEGNRSFSTSIYYLLQNKDVSHFHIINQDELWHFYDGVPIDLHLLFPNGNYKIFKLGKNLKNKELPQIVIPRNTYFGACIPKGKGYSLVGCTVAPGFEYTDFYQPDRAMMLHKFPKHKDIILKLTK